MNSNECSNFELIFFANADELTSRAANAWLDEIAAANHAARPHCVALSGGRIAQKFFASTVEQAKLRKISFEHVHFFWADERCVPPTDQDSNFKLANDLLFAPLKISENQIHRIRGEDSPEAAVKIAEIEICRVVPGAPSSPSPPQKEERAGVRRPIISDPLTPTLSPLGRGEGVDSLPVLDLIFLGLGEDGHVASLFPNKTEGTISAEIFCAVKNSPKPPPDRISVSYAAIAAAKQVWVLASGTGKTAALRESLISSGKTPLARVIQSRSCTRILTDIRLD